MGTDLHWRKKPRTFDDRTWFSMNVAGRSFYQTVLGEEWLDNTKPPPIQTFPYDLDTKTGCRKRLAQLRRLLKRPDDDPEMLKAAKGNLDSDYPWREAVQRIIDYIVDAQKHGGIVSS